MGDRTILLSICIPTNGNVEWIMPVIESIYVQKVDNSLFEVVVTDNGNKSDLENAVRNVQHNNFHYYRTNSQGFTNQIAAFEKCTGVFCKMLNHRSKMLPGSIDALLRFVKRYQDKMPILYCAERHARGEEFIECANTDEFVKSLGIWTSWSAGTCVWRDDLKRLKGEKIDNLFPHTVFLFNLRKESEYVIWNGKYEIMANDVGKGGYDVFYAFGVRFLDILSKLRCQGRLSDKTFVDVKKDMFFFLVGIYYNNVIRSTKYTFLIQNIRQSINIYYGDFYYFKLILKAWLLVPKKILSAVLKRIARK